MSTIDEVYRLWHKLRLLNATYGAARDGEERARIRASIYVTYRRIRRLGIARSVFID